ncbi:hypothetical protein GF323_03010 [Candidatus Woesearchaeota archaeon]|nr:hypothetical protein [Candidatus Woesearchaeota archaeon]
MAHMDLIGEEDIEEVFAESNSQTIKEIVKPVEKALELFQKNISTLSYLPDVERVTLG